MKDSFGREIDYIRISVTNDCNLNCRYCRGESAGGQSNCFAQMLSSENIIDVCAAAAELGICKVKITGGEPLLRKDIASLCKKINAISGISEVTMTTNGILLGHYAESLYDAGIKNVNVSLDTIDRERYRCITGFDGVNSVLKAVDTALECGIRVKINSVLYRDAFENDDELLDNCIGLADYFCRMGIDVRFIELMPIGPGTGQIKYSGHTVLNHMKKIFGTPGICNETVGNGPAVYYSFDGLSGRIGFINAIHDKFCDRCNRIRLTPEGRLKACLCYGENIDLLPIIRKKNRELLVSAIREVVNAKPREHCFEDNANITEKRKMVDIGG